jgi:glutamate transport system permease protein
MTDNRYENDYHQKGENRNVKLEHSHVNLIHPTRRTQEYLGLGVEAQGLEPENRAAAVPIVHRGSRATLLFDNLGPSALKKVRIFNVIAVALFIALFAWIVFTFWKGDQLSLERWGAALSLDAWTNFYLPGLLSTLSVSVFAVLVAIIFGILFGSLRVIPTKLCKVPSGIVVEFARAVPVLILMIFFWRLFSLTGMGVMSSFAAVFISLVLYNGSVIAELVRSGVNNLPKGQSEAALSLGMPRIKSLIKIELPQAIKQMLPAIATQLIVVIKDTALGSIIMFTDLLHESRRLGGATDSILQVLIVSTVLYFLICWVVSALMKRVFDSQK